MPSSSLSAKTRTRNIKSKVSSFQQYDKARTLLLAADGVIHSVSYQASRMIRNEVLYVDLLQYYSANGSITTELTKRVKACINSLHIERGNMTGFLWGVDPISWGWLQCEYLCKYCSIRGVMEWHIYPESPSSSAPPQFCYSIRGGGEVEWLFFRSQNIMDNLFPHAVPQGWGKQNGMSREVQKCMGLWQNVPLCSPSQ